MRFGDGWKFPQGSFLMMEDSDKWLLDSILENAATIGRALGGSSYPKVTIQKVVEQWFIDGKEDESYVINLIYFIENKRYQKTAINHLAYIKRYGFLHFRRNEPPKVEV